MYSFPFYFPVFNQVFSSVLYPNANFHSFIYYAIGSRGSAVAIETGYMLEDQNMHSLYAFKCKQFRNTCQTAKFGNNCKALFETHCISSVSHCMIIIPAFKVVKLVLEHHAFNFHVSLYARKLQRESALN
jgi:hypothetical protein